MSEPKPTEPLLRDLVAGLQPVTRIPRLGTVAIAILAAFVAALVVYWSFGGPPPMPADAPYWRDAAFIGVLAGLTLTAVGALTAALSGAVPGRGKPARLGRALLVGGLALTFGAAAAAVAFPAGQGAAMPLGASLTCLIRACAVGLLPVLVASGFLGRGVTRSPVVAVAVAALGAFALGAAIVHSGCAYSHALHMLMGHALAPFVASLVAALPLALLVRVVLRRSAPG